MSKRSPKQVSKMGSRLASLELQHLKDEKERSIPIAPPLLRFSTSFRYQQTAAGTSTVTWPSLFFCYGFTASTTTFKSAIEALKVLRIHVWIPGNIATSSTALLSPAASIAIKDSMLIGAGVEKQYQVFADGGKVAYFTYKPRGIMGDWVNYDYLGAEPEEVLLKILTVAAPAIVQMDMALQLQVSNSFSGNPAMTITVDATTASQYASAYLDGLNTLTQEGTQLLSPVGLAGVTANMPRPAPVSSSLPLICASSLPAAVCCSCGKSRGCSTVGQTPE